MEIKREYKQTDNGAIPESWQLLELREACERIGVGLATSVTKYYRNYGVPIVRNLNIKDGWFDGSDMLFLDEEFAKANKGKAAKALDVLTVHTGSNLGLSCVLPEEYSNCQTFTTLITTPKKGLLDSHYLCAHMGSAAGMKEMERLEVGGGKGNLNTSDLKQYKIAVPPIEEQRATATALSDVDAMIAAQDKLIAKKRAIKTATMQQLLTGTKRLPGFGGEWEVKRLGDMGKFLKGSGVRKDEAQSGDLPCIRYGEIYTHHNDLVRTYNSRISQAIASTAVRLKRGDLLFAGSGETKEEIGKCVAFIEDCESYAGGDIVILRLNDADPIFMGYYCNTTPINKQKASKGQGDAVVHISASGLASIEVKLPCVLEQTAIANVLFDMDTEITALEVRRDKTKAIKQGMMQELLTGRTRLI